MEQSIYEMRVLTPAAGKYLTQADPEMGVVGRIITPNKLYLARTDSPENWKEIDAEEAEALLAEQEAHFKAEEAEREAQRAAKLEASKAAAECESCGNVICEENPSAV